MEQGQVQQELAPKIYLVQTIIAKVEAVNLIWGKAPAAAKDKTRWRVTGYIRSLYSPWNERVVCIDNENM